MEPNSSNVIGGLSKRKVNYEILSNEQEQVDMSDSIAQITSERFTYNLWFGFIIPITIDIPC